MLTCISDDELVSRTRSLMTMLERAERLARPDPRLGSEMLPRAEYVNLLRRTLEALDFFKPYFHSGDELIKRARRSLWFRIFSRDKPDSTERLLKIRRGFEKHLDNVGASSKPFVDADYKITDASRHWIEWHEHELRLLSQGPYR